MFLWRYYEYFSIDLSGDHNFFGDNHDRLYLSLLISAAHPEPVEGLLGIH